MGSAGFMRCCVCAIPGFMGPFGGIVFYTLASMFLRQTIESKFKVEEEKFF
jgi:hypothetical protein